MLATQAFVVVGILTIKYKNDHVKISKEYFAFSLVMVFILVAGITVPFFASALNTTRLYQISLIFLAIFFVIGWLNVSRLLGGIFKRSDPKMPLAFRTLAIFLVIFLAFNTGLIFELANDAPTSYSLNRTTDNEVYNYAEVAGADWIVSGRNATPIDGEPGEYYLPPIYSDRIRLILMEAHYVDQVTDIPENQSQLFEISYIYLGTYNIVKDQVLIATDTGTRTSDKYVDASSLSSDRGRIYSNGGAEIYGRSW
jgi:uncharacterized membrane protein